MSIINKWSVFCQTENAELEVLSISGNPPPIHCPTDSSHSVDPSRTFLVQVIEDKEVKIREELIHTQGFFKIEGKMMACPANTSVSQTVDLLYAVSVLAFYLSPSPENYKDTIDVYVNLGPIGVTTASIVEGATSFQIGTPVFNNIPIGFEILINNVCVGEVFSKNSITSTLTMDIPIPQAFAANSTVSLRNRMMKKFIIGLAPRYDFGTSTIGGSYMTPTYSISVTYNNISLTEDKDIIYYIEYLY